MSSRLPRILIFLIFVGILAAVFRANHRSAPPVSSGLPAADSLARYGLHFDEVASASGIHAVHQPPVLDAKLAHIMPQVASMGAAVAIADFDRDGWPDLYVPNSAHGSLNHLYRNRHDGQFEDVAAKMGVADVNRPETGCSMGAVWGDYDNDGYEDLLVYKWGRPELFHNDGGKKFTRVTGKANLPAWVNANSATWLDFDRDGKLDLFIAGYYPENVNLWHLTTTKMMPDSFEYANNGGRKYLLRGRGDGTFEDVTSAMGINSRRWTLAVVAADLHGTGYPDLVLANDYGYTEVLQNEAGKRFREVGMDALYWDKLGTGPKSGMSASVGDVFNQGKFAVYISNITSQAGNLLQYNNLWMPREAKPGEPLRYDNMATEMGVGDGGWSFGAQFGDLNNDGAPDLFLTNGYVSASKEKDYWYDYSKIAGGNAAIISDAKNWPPMQGRSLSGYEQKRVWLSDGFGKFNDVAQAVGITQTTDGRAVALADLWNRGVLDVVVANQNAPLCLYRNTVPAKNLWIGFDLEGARSNRSAIGAHVELFWKTASGQTRHQVQEVAAASGFCAQNERRLHFGLGPGATVEKAIIQWPSGGKSQTVPAPAAGQMHHLKELAS